jgi:hypothetical protein
MCLSGGVASLSQTVRQTEGLLTEAVDSFMCRFSNCLSLLFALLIRI